MHQYDANRTPYFAGCDSAQQAASTNPLGNGGWLPLATLAPANGGVAFAPTRPTTEPSDNVAVSCTLACSKVALECAAAVSTDETLLLGCVTTAAACTTACKTEFLTLSPTAAFPDELASGSGSEVDEGGGINAVTTVIVATAVDAATCAWDPDAADEFKQRKLTINCFWWLIAGMVIAMLKNEKDARWVRGTVSSLFSLEAFLTLAIRSRSTSTAVAAAREHLHPTSHPVADSDRPFVHR
jgi:hypothetical protein